MDIRIDTNPYTVGAPPLQAAVRFSSGILAGQTNCASEVSLPSAPTFFNQYPLAPRPQSHPPSQQGPSCVNFSQPPPPGNFGGGGGFFASSAPPPSSTFSHQQSTPKKVRNYDAPNYQQRGYEQQQQQQQQQSTFQRFAPGPSQQAPMPPFTGGAPGAVNSNQPPFRRCNSMGVASGAGNFRMNVPQPPPGFGPDAYPPQQLPPPRDLGRMSRGMPPSQQQQQQQPLLASHHSNNKRYVSGGCVQKAKKKYDRKNDQNNSSYRNKLLKDKRSQGFYDSSSMMMASAGQRAPKRKWTRNSNEKPKRFCDSRITTPINKKSTRWTECNSTDIVRVHRNCVENGQPLAPYNTTQFIMNEHMAEKEFDFDESSGAIQHHRRLSEGSDFDEAEDYSSPAEDENQYLERQFNEAFQNMHRESLTKKSKDELVSDLLMLEKKYSSLNKSHSSSMRTISKVRAKELKYHQTRQLLREVYFRHSKLLAESVQNSANTVPAATASDSEISLQKRVRLDSYHLPQEIDYMIRYCLEESGDDDNDDDDNANNDTSSSSSSDCDSEYSSSSDSSYGSEFGNSDDVDLEVAGVLHDLLELVHVNSED